MNKYTHLFFDLDRTLWDFEANSLETFQELYKEFSLRVYFPDFFTFHNTFQSINSELWEKYLQGTIEKEELRWKRFSLTLAQYGCDDVSFAKQLADIYIERSPLKNKLFKGAIETLKILKSKFRMFILTNGFAEVQIIKVKSCGLSEYMERVFTSEEVGVHKPGIQFFEYVLAQLNVAPENCLMIGDDFKTDIAGAQNCNIDQVFFNPDKTKVSGSATFVIEELNELTKILL